MILSKMAKDGASHEVSVAHEDGMHDEYSAFAEDIISAVKDGSVMELAKCLKAFHEMIKEDDEMQDAEE